MEIIFLFKTVRWRHELWRYHVDRAPRVSHSAPKKPQRNAAMTFLTLRNIQRQYGNVPAATRKCTGSNTEMHRQQHGNAPAATRKCTGSNTSATPRRTRNATPPWDYPLQPVTRISTHITLLAHYNIKSHSWDFVLSCIWCRWTSMLLGLLGRTDDLLLSDSKVKTTYYYLIFYVYFK